MKKILLSIATLGVVGAMVVGGTTAIFSDTEVSTGNTFTAGAIDLTIDNESYYNGVFNRGTSWLQKDLTDGDWFFHFEDLKPGDWGEDTISLHVNNNDSYLCADVTLKSNQDNGSTEPELNDETPYTAGEGELADHVNFIAWADDGDNVLEDNEYAFDLGTLGGLRIGETATAALADSTTNLWNPAYAAGPLPGDVTKYIGKAWCFGNLDLAASTYPQDDLGADNDNGPDVRKIVCDGSRENNLTQTDSMTADVSFRSVQARHNESFVCEGTEPVDGTITVDKEIVFTTEDNPVQISDFELHVYGPTDGTPVDHVVIDEVSLAGLLPGTYEVSEEYNGSTSFSFDPSFSLDCTDSNSDNVGEMTLEAGDNLTCRMTNREVQG